MHFIPNAPCLQRPRVSDKYGAVFKSSNKSIILIGRDIEEYSVTTEKWSGFEMNLSLRCDCGTLLTSNQRYILVFGGWKRNDILVVDMKNDNEWEVKRSKICCPLAGECIVSRTGGDDSKDEILVIGFIRQCFESTEFDHLQLPPVYLMMIIVNKYSAEMVHWFQGTEHRGIYLKDILRSLTDFE